MSENKVKPRLASQQDQMIAAVIGSFYRFSAQEDALATLAVIAREFTQAKEREHPREDGTPQLRLWIRGYEVSANDKTTGYVGHFARMWVEFLPSGYYTLKAEKITTPLARHPEKSPVKGKHPNRDNKLMRAVERGKKFKSFEEASALLAQMHQDYPLATIPGQQQLHIMLYSRHKNTTGGGIPIEKITVKVKILPEGGAKLVIVKKLPRKTTPTNKPPASEPASDSVTTSVAEGKFTTMVQKRRRKQRPATQ